MAIRSLSARLLLTSLGWSVFALVATGIVLTSAFRQSVEARFDETLSVYLSTLIGELADTADEGFAGPPTDLGEPRFVLPLSGWYWLVVDAASGNIVQSSESLEGDAVPLPPGLAEAVPGRLHRSYGEGPTGESLRIVGRRVAFEEGEWVYVMVAGAAETIEADTARFMTRLGVVLSIFAAILVAATFVQWRISLRPLRRLGRELQAIREGNARHVSTRYPTEIAPVAAALNDLIDSNHATLERSRRHVGNLAHALKTPISVLVNDAAGAEGPLARSVREQTAIMERQVRFYLERAQMAARERTIGMVTQVAPVLSRLHRAMARLGERRGIDVHLENGHEVRFAGEQQDLEEIVGNLVDNALKFAHGRVTITVSPTADPPTRREGGFFRITIADDGPGLSEAEREAVLSRGKRLDQSKPGSGLGLSIVAELVELYGGALCLGCPPAGGLEVAVVLPRA